MTTSNDYKLTLPPGTQEISIGLLPGYIAAVMEPSSKIDFSETKQAAIMLKHNVAIQKASLNGELVGRNPTSKIKQPFAIGDQLNRSILFVNELFDYLSRYGITVEVAEPSINSGRYNLIDAAKTLGKATGESEKRLLEKIKEAVANDLLPTYWPTDKVDSKQRIIRDFAVEVYWNDLNKWMESELSRLPWRFPAPTNGAENNHVKTNKKHKNMERHSEKRYVNKTLCELYPKLPNRQDQWCKPIIDVLLKYDKKHKNFPDKDQAWAALWDNPPEGYGISAGKDRGGEHALVMGGKKLSRSALKKRLVRWSG